MRIALLPSADLSYESGSIIQAKMLLRYLLGQGHDVWLLSSQPPTNLSEKEIARVQINPAILEHPVIDDRPVAGHDLATSLSESVSFLSSLHRQMPLDLVHAQYLSFTSLAAASFGAATGVPVVVSSFGRDLSIGIVHDRRVQAMAAASLRGVDHVLCPSEAVKARLLEFATPIAPGLPVSIVPAALDPDVLLGTSEPQSAGSPLISTVNSCFTPEKGIDDIIAAFAIILSHFPGAKLVIAGADDHPQQENKRRLCALVRSLHLDDAVRFTGYLSRQDVGALIRSSNIVVDGRTQGNFSSFLLEAQFLGAAVICSDVPSARLIVTSEFNGLMFKAGCPADLAQKALRLLSNEHEMALLRENAVKWREGPGQIFGGSTVMNQIEKLYYSLIGAKA